jgi:Phasin protein
MAKSQTDSLASSPTALDSLGEGVQAMMARQQRVALDGYERFAEASLRFWGKRMLAYADHLKALQNCGSTADMMSCNNDFLAKSMAEYAEEAREAMEFSKTTLGENVEAVHKAAA